MKTALLIFIAASAIFAGTVNYAYDTAGRLTKVDYGAAGSITYEYDKAGNLSKRTVTGPSSAAPASARDKASLKAEEEGKGGKPRAIETPARRRTSAPVERE